MTPFPNLSCRCHGDHGEIKSNPPTCDFFHDTWKTTRNPSSKNMEKKKKSYVAHYLFHLFEPQRFGTTELRTKTMLSWHRENCRFAWIRCQFFKVTWLHHGARWWNDLKVKQQIYQRILEICSAHRTGRNKYGRDTKTIFPASWSKFWCGQRQGDNFEGHNPRLHAGHFFQFSKVTSCKCLSSE